MRKYILVNTITAISLIIGLIAIYFVLNGYLYLSFGFILIASIFDSLDGLLARLLKAESRFGAIFDTLADIIVYLLYPSFLLFQAFEMNNVIESSLIIIFILAGLFRLIRFTNIGFYVEDQKKYYLGMPVFFSHLLVLILLILNIIDKTIMEITGSFLLTIMSALMVTKFKFKKPTSIILGIIMLVIAIVAVIMFNIQQ